jgi:hypothetical protein
MFNKRLCASLAAALTLAACGGGDDNKLSREYGLLLLVNGSQVIGDKTLVKKTLDRTNSGANFETCLQTVKDSGGNQIQVPLYDNYEEMGGENSEYCNGTRVNASSTIAFQARFINNTFDPMTISYRGMGLEIRVYDENEVEVWNSIVAQDVALQAANYPPFDPFAEYTAVLAAGESYPNQRNFAITYYFFGDRNYADSDLNSATYNLEDDLVGLGWVSGDPGASSCEPAKLQPGVEEWESGKTRLYQKPQCQSIPLPVGRYRVLVEYSFTPYIPPVEFYINLEAEPT